MKYTLFCISIILLSACNNVTPESDILIQKVDSCANYAIIGEWSNLNFNGGEDKVTVYDDCTVERAACFSKWKLPANLEPTFSEWQEVRIEVLEGNPINPGCLPEGEVICQMKSDIDFGLQSKRLLFQCGSEAQLGYLDI